MVSRVKKSLVDQIYNYCRKEYGAGTKYQVASQLKTGHGLGQFKVYQTINLLNDKNENVKCELPSSALQSDLLNDVIESEEKVSKKAKKGRTVYTCISNPKNEVKEILESDPTALSVNHPGRKVIIEFSSPNIAKPLNFAHIRSTIIGNGVANIKEKLGEKVIRLNYLGDWGTQFGSLNLGLESARYSDQLLKEKPLELLFEAHEKANAEAENNSEFREKALKFFADAEEGNNNLETWEKLKGYTADNLKNIYERLGVRFDEYQWESSFRKSEITEIFNKIKGKNLLVTDEKSRVCAKVKDELIPLIKSDGSSLYLARDIAAIYDRRSKYDFDEIYYVADGNQSGHFKNLIKICDELEFDRAKNVEHVKLSMFKDFETRKGQLVSLQNVFDEAKSLIQERFEEKGTNVDEKVADLLGISGLVIGDLKEKKGKPYDFDWNKILNFEGDTGVKIQYTHLTLHNLLERYQDKVAKESDPEVFSEDQAIHLLNSIRKYDERILEADVNLEPHVLAKYLLNLSKASNDAFQTLKIEDVDSHVASQRLLLFQSTRKVLEDGLKLLGLKALKKI